MLYNCEKIVFHIYITYCCSELKVRVPLLQNMLKYSWQNIIGPNNQTCPEMMVNCVRLCVLRPGRNVRNKIICINNEGLSETSLTHIQCSIVPVHNTREVMSIRHYEHQSQYPELSKGFVYINQWKTKR